ncbi:MAG: AIR carboxylase family protein [Nanoarchaeota archaeon]|nr:AIR carboxylase family protein [Nanoarchaeota archaeon]
MITEAFKNKVEQNLGCVVILAGSGSDKPHIDKIVSSLKEYQIPYEVRIASAHKQPIGLDGIIREYDDLEGALAYVAVAGNTDALSGTVSFQSHRPVISCPPDHPNYSCLTNPPGSSNAYVGKPENAARFIAQIFSHQNKTYSAILNGSSNKKKLNLLEQDNTLRQEYAGNQK